MFFAKLNTRTKIILSMQCIGMLSGTATHLLWVIENGFLSDNYHASFFTKCFWDSLTFLDLIAAILLIVKPKAGIWLTLMIIIADVLHNGILSRQEFLADPFILHDWIERNWMLLCQVTFGIFVVVTCKANLKEIKSAAVPSV
jgi:hypothetical protein